MLLIGNGKLLTRDGENPFLESGAVLTDVDMIREVGAYEDLKSKYPEAEFIDARGGIIMPGFINAHTHIYSALARGLSIPGYNPTNFYEILDGMWWHIDRRLSLSGTRASAMATVIDCIKQGVTTIFDHHASYGGIRGSLFEIADIARKYGIRACLCYEVSDRDGEEKCRDAIEENADFIRWAAEKGDDDLRAMFGLHAAFTLSDKTLEDCVKANGGKAGFHIHVCEGRNDVEDSARYGLKTVERLDRFGILGDRTILGHCIHIDGDEMDIIRARDSMVVNNPESNMGNAVGCSPVLEMYRRGLTLGLGTDAYTNDMLESIKAALCIQRHNAGMPNVGWAEVTDMLFKNNPAIAERFFGMPIGVLKPGAAADIIVMDYKPFTPFSGANADGHMIFGMTGRQCRTTIARGKALMVDGVLTGIDEDAANAEIMAEAKKLWASL